MTFRPTPLAAALLIAAVPAAFAQGRVTDGSSNTIVFADAGGSLTTRATVAAKIDQQSLAATGNSTQALVVGGLQGATVGAGTLRAEGTLTGTVSQVRTATANGNSEQVLLVGAASGTVGAGNVQALGTLTAPVNQTVAGTGLRSMQRLEIGSVDDVSGGTLKAVGTVSGGAVSQVLNGSQVQIVRVGTLLNSSAQQATISGSLTGGLSQVALSGSGLQSVAVGALDGSQAGSVTTSGTVSGAVIQDLTGNGQQTLNVGSVTNVDGGGGTITTSGTLTGAVRQVASAGGAGREQTLRIASVTGGAPQRVDTRAVVSGDVVQLIAGDNLARQQLSVGAATGVRGTVSTDATVLGPVTQTADGSAVAASRQTIAIASADDSSGTVSTRAVVGSGISQSTRGVTQVLNVGSVAGSLGARTDVTVNGSINQVGGAAADGRQFINLGGVVGAAAPQQSQQQ